MKSTITAALALVLLAGTASAALAQDDGQNGGERPQFRDTERRDMMGGADNRGQRRSEFQAAQTPAAPPQAREAPTAPAAPQARQPHEGGHFRGGDYGQGQAQPQPQGQPQAQPQGQGQFRANRDMAGRQQDAARQRDYEHRRDQAGGQVVVMPPRPENGSGAGQRYGGRQPDGRPDVNGGTGTRDGRRWEGDHNGDRNGGDRYGGDRRDWDRHDGDRYGRNDHRDWDRHDDRGRPHWQQGRYPSVYRSQHRYRYSGGYYRPPIGFYAYNWGFGDFLPRGWYGPDYLLYDWWSYGLPYPPPGYDWVRVGDDALLIDSYTGRVVQVVRFLFW